MAENPANPANGNGVKYAERKQEDYGLGDVIHRLIDLAAVTDSERAQMRQALIDDWGHPYVADEVRNVLPVTTEADINARINQAVDNALKARADQFAAAEKPAEGASPDVVQSLRDEMATLRGELDKARAGTPPIKENPPSFNPPQSNPPQV